jgi:hypothetical protein
MISTEMHRRLLAALAVFALCAAGCKSSTSAPAPTAPTGTPTILSLSASGNLTLDVGDSQQLKAVALMSDGSTQILTTAATWTSSNSAIATVDPTGIVKGVTAGTASISVVNGGVSGAVTLVVSAAGAESPSYVGTVSAPANLSGTVTLTSLSTSRATGSLRIGLNTVALIGRFDSTASVLNLSGASDSVLGTLSNGVVTGTFTSAGGTGGFSALDATHTAVTTYCGTYSGSDGTMGAWNVAVSIAGPATANSTQSDGAAAPLVFTGAVSGTTLSLTAPGGLTGSGSVSGGLAAGSFSLSSSTTGTFTASSSACR